MMNAATSRKRLRRAFFMRKTPVVARLLLGKILARKIGKMVYRARIMETEAYCGPRDMASHARHGKTPRAATMFERAGTAYVYLIYGMYHCLNVVTGRKEYPAAVLIRALEPMHHTPKRGRTDGPGRLCSALGITKALNGADIVTGATLWIEDAPDISRRRVRRRKRIGVDYAGAWKDKEWRYVIQHQKRGAAFYT